MREVPSYAFGKPALLIQFGYLRDCLFRIKTDRFSPFDQLDQGDALLSYFDVADIGLGAAQPFGEINLAQAGDFAAFDQPRPQRFVTAGILGPRHSASRSSLRESKQDAWNLHLDILHKMIEPDATRRFCFRGNAPRCLK